VASDCSSESSPLLHLRHDFFQLGERLLEVELGDLA
jgi:hypothetical protein